MRRIIPFAVFLVTSVAVSAPVPKDFETPAKKLERLFGTPDQPDGTKVELDGNRLKVSVPHLPAGKPGEAGVYASPRTARAVSGDFEFTVSVTVTTPADVPVDAWAGVYVGFDEKGHFDLFTMDLGSGQLSRLTENQGDFQHASWAPNGRAVVAAGLRSGIYIITADGKTVRQVWKGSASAPSWGPGHRSLLDR